MPELRQYEGGRISKPHIYLNALGDKVILLPLIRRSEGLPFVFIRNLDDLKTYMDAGGSAWGLLPYLEEIGINPYHPTLRGATLPATSKAWKSTGGEILYCFEGENKVFPGESDFFRLLGFLNCEICGNYASGEGIYLPIGDSRCFCVSCQPQTSACAACSEVGITRNFRAISGLEGRVCRSCSSGYHHCDDCDEYHITRFCPNANLDNIQDHGFAPAIVKYGGPSKFPFHIGMELELTTDYAIETLREIRKKHGDLFWGVYDGSVSGVELVSHPATIEFWQKFQLGAPSHCKEGGNGIHLHACRSGFNHSQIKSVLKLFASSHDKVKTIAERDEKLEEWAAIAESSRINEVRDFQSFTGWDKYSAVNFNHKHTYEFRIFNSSKISAKIIKNIEFIGSLWDWTKNGSISGDPDWESYLDYAGKSEFGFLKSFLADEALI